MSDVQEVKLKINKTANIKDYQKQYQEANKARILYKRNQNYINNRAIKLAYMRVPNICNLCNGKYTNVNKCQHLKSQKHLKSQNKIEPNNVIKDDINIKSSYIIQFMKYNKSFIKKDENGYEMYSDYEDENE